jgi:hypothetical protein
MKESFSQSEKSVEAEHNDIPQLLIDDFFESGMDAYAMEIKPELRDENKKNELYQELIQQLAARELHVDSSAIHWSPARYNFEYVVREGESESDVDIIADYTDVDRDKGMFEIDLNVESRIALYTEQPKIKWKKSFSFQVSKERMNDLREHTRIRREKEDEEDRQRKERLNKILPELFRFAEQHPKMRLTGDELNPIRSILEEIFDGPLKPNEEIDLVLRKDPQETCEIYRWVDGMHYDTLALNKPKNQ